MVYIYIYRYECVCVSFVTLWVLRFLEVLQPVSVESPNTVSGRYAYARDPLQLDSLLMLATLHQGQSHANMLD